MIVSNEISLKKKVSVSKNRKKSWRKHCDVSEVEDHLEEKRKEEILGGPVADKSNEQIFFQDKTEIPKKVLLKRKYQRDKPLRCFRALVNDSKVNPPLIPQKLAKRTIRNAANYKKRCDAKKELTKERNVGAANIKKEKESQLLYNSEMVTGTYDVWDPEDAPFGEKIEPEIEDERINEYYKKFMKKKSFKVPKVRLPKEVLRSAVEIPHQGTSYNPSYDDHQELLEMACREELKKIQDQKRLQNKTIRAVDSEKLKESYLEEMSQGLVEANDMDDESDVDCSAPLSVNPPVRADDRKTKQKRRRASEHKKRISEIRVKKIQAYRERQALKIPQLKSQIVANEARNKARKAKRAKKRAAKALLPKRTSSGKYEAPAIDVTLTQDLVGSLYKIKTEGNLAVERMKSYERRSIIATKGVGRRAKKLKRKTYVKRNFRDAET